MNIFLLELRNLRRSIVSSTISICGVIVLMLAFFPSMKTESMKALAGAKLEGFDSSLLAAFGLSEMMDFTIITNYFGYAMQYITLTIMVILTQRAVGLFAKEESEGTIEYLASKPVSRGEIFYQKTLALLVSFLFMIATFIAITIIGYIQVTDYTLGEAVKEVLILFGSVFFVGLVFSAVGILVSTLLKGGKGMGGIPLAIVFGTFILGIFSIVIKQLDFLIWFSPMDWIKTQKLMTKGILLEEWIIGITVIVVCACLAWLIYRKKDLLV